MKWWARILMWIEGPDMVTCRVCGRQKFVNRWNRLFTWHCGKLMDRSRDDEVDHLFHPLREKGLL